MPPVVQTFFIGGLTVTVMCSAHLSAVEKYTSVAVLSILSPGLLECLVLAPCDSPNNRANRAMTGQRAMRRLPRKQLHGLLKMNAGYEGRLHLDFIS